MTRRAGGPHASPASSLGPPMTAEPHSAVHTHRRRHRHLSTGDRVALGAGAALALLMLVWFAWRLAQTVVRDSAVAPGVQPAPAMPGH